MARGQKNHTSLSKARASGNNRADLSERGLRMPLHNWMTEGNARDLRPLFAAPLRPAETLVGMQFNNDAMFQQMAKVAWFVPIDVECAVWKVPISSLGDEFVDLLVADAEDDWGGAFPSMGGTGVTAESAGQLSGPQSRTTHHSQPRPWAGENGPVGLPATTNDYYTPYVSTAVWHVARAYYELELSQDPQPVLTLNPRSTTLSRDDDTYLTQPPPLGPHIRTALSSAVPVGSIGGSPDYDQDATAGAFADSISEWAERLSLLTKPNQTYMEYLADFGVDGSRVGNMPEPIMIQRRTMGRLGSPQGFANLLPIINPGVTPFHEVHGESVFSVFQNAGATATYQIYGDTAGMANFGCSFDLTRGRRIFVEEPSILLGTWAFWPWMHYQGDMSHYLEMCRMTHGAHWGNPIGGVDETDFLSASNLWNQDGTSGAIPSEQQTGGGSTQAYNLLNLYLNGDNFSNTNANFNPFTVGRGLAQQGAFTAQENAVAQQRVNCIGKAQLAIATDLVK